MTVLRGRVIRCGDAHRSAEPIAPRAEGRRVAQALLVARAEADRILEDANKVAETRLETWRREAIEGAIVPWMLALREEERRAAALCDRVADRVMGLAREVSERILGREVRDPDGWHAYVKTALHELRASDRVTVSMHPDDIARLEQRPLELGALREILHIVPSSALSPGDLIFYTNLGTLHAQLPSRLDRLFDRLAEYRSDEASDRVA